ncbi:PQQ-binding-like beta-propeller repeat protein, partial [Streptomyces sp. SBT349]|uniref:PQQ-binding-like beta-propeller repeat protein n=1 Tax=Streptomyces sp. SBT349 TaxID=1580539 RepID=UPI00066A1801
SGEPGGPAEPAGAMAELWRTRPVEGGDPDTAATTVEIRRVWLSDGVVVLLTRGGVWGLDPESGQELWRLEHPGGGDLVPCATSGDVNGQGVGAVLYRPEDDPGDHPNCTVLAAVDTLGGEVLWSEDLTRPDDSAVGYNDEVPVTVGERVVTVDVGRQPRGPHRFAVEDGEELPALEVPGGEDCALPGSRWQFSARHTLAMAECAATGDREGRLTVFDTETGAELWTRPEAPSFLRGAALFADEPLTLSSRTGVTVYGDDGEARREIPVEYIDSDLEIGSAERAAAYEAVDRHLTDSLLITRSSNDDDDPDLVRGIDVETGEERWRRDFPEDGFLVGDVDEEPLVFYEAEADDGRTRHHVAWLDPANGTPAVEGLLPQDTGDDFGFLTPVAWDERTLYVVGTNPVEGTSRLQAVRR